MAFEMLFDYKDEGQEVRSKNGNSDSEEMSHQ